MGVSQKHPASYEAPIVLIPNGRKGNPGKVLEVLTGIYNSGILRDYPKATVVLVGFEKYGRIEALGKELFRENFVYVDADEVLGHLRKMGYHGVASLLEGCTYGNVRNISLLAVARYCGVGTFPDGHLRPILWLDDDCIPQGGWYKQHLEFLGRNKGGSVVIATVGEYSGAGASMDVDVLANAVKNGRALEGFVPPNNTISPNKYVGYLLGGNMAMLGIPPIPFVPGKDPIRDEEGILAMELRRSGYRIRSVTSVVEHKRVSIKNLQEAICLAYWSRVSDALERTLSYIYDGEETEKAIEDAINEAIRFIDNQLHSLHKELRIKRKAGRSPILPQLNQLRLDLQNDAKRILTEVYEGYKALKRWWNEVVQKLAEEHHIES